MRALRLEQWKSEPVLVEVPVPEAGPGQVLVKIGAAGAVSLRTAYRGTRPELAEVLAVAARGLFTPEISTFSRDDAQDASAQMDRGTPRGRAVIIPRSGVDELGAPRGDDRVTTTVAEHTAELVVLERAAADDVVSLVLGDPDGAELPAWTPGAHIDLLLPGPLTRQYSLSGSPADRHTWRIGVLLDRAGRGGSRLVHDGLQVGATVPVRGPRNHFPLVTAERYLFLAGGIGITPLLPMVAAAGDEWALHYGGRRRASMAFTAELAAYSDRVQLWPEDERGMLDLAALLDDPQPGTAVYTCGPEGLLAAVEARCAHWPPGSLHLERFSARPTAAVAAPAGLDVVCQRSGITVTVPADRSILEVVQEAGVGALSSCLEGVCGTCETAVLEGVPDHRDSLLSEQERAAGDYMMICVSRALTPRLVLDL